MTSKGQTRKWAHAWATTGSKPRIRQYSGPKPGRGMGGWHTEIGAADGGRATMGWASLLATSTKSSPSLTAGAGEAATPGEVESRADPP